MANITKLKWILIKKIILHKASCLAYINEMKNKINIDYVKSYPIVKNTVVYMFEINDKYIAEEIQDFYKKLNTQIIILDSQNFMTKYEDLKTFYDQTKNKNHFVHGSFYNYQIKIHKIPYIMKNKKYAMNGKNLLINMKITSI